MRVKTDILPLPGSSLTKLIASLSRQRKMPEKDMKPIKTWRKSNKISPRGVKPPGFNLKGHTQPVMVRMSF